MPNLLASPEAHFANRGATPSDLGPTTGIWEWAYQGAHSNLTDQPDVICYEPMQVTIRGHGFLASWDP